MKQLSGDTSEGIMRLLMAAVAIVFLIHAAPAIGEENGQAMKEAELKVSGMFCSSCSAAVETALKKLPGVAEAHADVKADKVTVRYDAKKVTPQQLVEALRKAGYQARWLAPPDPPARTRGY